MGEEKVLYSVKMRSSLMVTHGVGGQHISRAERIVTKEQRRTGDDFHAAPCLGTLLWREDFIQFKVGQFKLNLQSQAECL